MSTDSTRAGAAPIRINEALREEHPILGPMPQRDFGMYAYTRTMPLIETALRRRAAQHSNVVFRENTPVLGMEFGHDGRRVTAVLCSAGRGSTVETLAADLVVDASGRGQPTLELPHSIGCARPQETAVGSL